MKKVFVRMALRVWGYLLKRALPPGEIKEWHLSQLEMSDPVFRKLRETYLQTRLRRADLALLNTAIRRKEQMKKRTMELEPEKMRTVS